MYLWMMGGMSLDITMRGFDMALGARCSYFLHGDRWALRGLACHAIMAI